MSEEREHGCATCRAHRIDEMELVSKTTQSVMNGKGSETDKVYACRTCGAKWCKTVESGFGGYGTFWTALP